MRIALYGGTFNPPHFGHLNTVKTLSGLYDRVIVMPAAVPPHKNMPEFSLCDMERLNLARLTFGGVENAEVSDFEIRKGGVSYTIDTLDALNADDITLVVGTDMLLSFEKWHRFEEILNRAEIAVFRRDERGVTEHIRYLREKYNAKIIEIDTDIIELSSSQLRGSETKNRLKVLETVSPKRMAHTLGTEYEAVLLANKFGADVEAAAYAAILHDCTKHWTVEKHLQFCEECNIILDDMSKKTVKALHSITATALARREFSVSDAVYNAIRHHTLGRSGMSALEMIIYLADKIEPTRKYSDVPHYRAVAYESLERGVLALLDMNIGKLIREGHLIHPTTVEARNFYLEATQ
ncbi:MAG: bis(5'-nucleosyl)-tetraphosphatase (symmetrical) YqeK [Oscillospiraceae bacterium]|nr:bis(5'-nucleosyl)-tetraphosphatase (symmetrical) YqeK [Oscillospiraceae bacterium]